jgi:competence protein ComEA
VTNGEHVVEEAGLRATHARLARQLGVRVSVSIVTATLAGLLTYGGAVRAAGKAVEGAVNLNTATPELLALLPGVGPAKAQSILSYRKRHPFRTVDELVRIKGIGRKMVRRLRAHLAVGGPTTASASVPSTSAAPAAPPPSPAKRLPAPALCLRPPARPARPPSRAPAATHGSCPPAP